MFQLNSAWAMFEVNLAYDMNV